MNNRNVLLITVDDMSWDSLGCMGCRVPDITPNIDRLAEEGVLCENSYVAIAVCQPSRSALMTGRYPHKNGARGFEQIDFCVTTLTEHLRYYWKSAPFTARRKICMGLRSTYANGRRKLGTGSKTDV